jgi:hypothetical protein
VAQTAVDIVVKVVGDQKLKQLDTALKGTAANSVKASAGLDKTATSTKRAGKAAATATGNIQRMGIAFRTTLAPLVGVTGALTLLNRSFATLGKREQDAQLLANGLQKLGAGVSRFNELQRAADEFGNATLFNQEDFTQAAGVLTSFTSIAIDEYQKVIDIAGDLAQTNNVGLKDSLLQVAKALNAPSQNLSALSRSGIQFSDTQKEVIKALEKTGRLAEAQKIILQELGRQYGGNAKSAAKGLAGAVDTLGEEFRDLQEAIGKLALAPTILLIQQLTDKLSVLETQVKNTATVINFMGKQIKFLDGVTLPLKDRFDKAQQGFNGFVSSLLAGQPALRATYELLRRIARIRDAAAKGIEDFNAASTVDTTPNQGAAVLDFDKINAFRDQLKLEDELKKLNTKTKTGGGRAAVAQNDTKSAQSMLQSFQDQVALLGAKTDLERELLQIEQDRADNLRQIAELQGIDGGLREQLNNAAELLAAEESRKTIIDDTNNKFKEFFTQQQAVKQAEQDALLPLQEQRALLEAKLNGTEEEVRLKQEVDRILRSAPSLERAFVEELVRGNAELETQVELVDAQKELWGSVGKTIQAGLVNGIQAAIDGSKDLNSILSDVLKQLGSLFLNAAFNGIGSALKLPNFAEGGRPPVGQYSIVGENGPELVKFDNAATVYSNQDSRAMLSQYSPGGGMSGGGGTIRFESTVINGVEYVTREEAEAIGTRAAQAGARGGHVKSMRTLQNSRSQRAKLGMR